MSPRRVDPGEDIAFFIQVSKELRNFARAFEKGTSSTNPVPILSEVIARLEFLKPLDEFLRASDVAAKAALAIGVKADDLYAHWRLAFLRRHTEVEELLAHASKITRESVAPCVKDVLKKEAAVRRYGREMNATSVRSPKHKNLRKKHDAACEVLERANDTLMDLIGAPGTPFNRGERYADDWKKTVSLSEELAGVSRRGLDPDGEAVKALRVTRGLTQAGLAQAVHDSGGAKLHVRTIRRIEAGKRVDVRTLKAVAETLDEDVSLLVL